MASAGDSGESLSLNIMPMLDIFSILLTFLLMSYSTDPVNHDLDENLELPDSVTLSNLDEVPSVSVTKDSIFINDKEIVKLVGGKVPEKDLSQGAIRPVFDELEKLMSMNRKVQNKVGSEIKKKNDSLTMEMDKSHDFELTRRVMLSAQQAEFIAFKLMVARESI